MSSISPAVKRIEDFELIGEKPGGQIEGGIYRDINGQKWLIKNMDNKSSVREAYAANTYRLIAGEEYVPETCLVEGVDVSNGAVQYMLASKFNDNFQPIDELSPLASYPLSEQEGKVLVNQPHPAGLLEIVIAAMILADSDIVGNTGGNSGFDQDKLFRIDFGQCFNFSSESYKMNRENLHAFYNLLYILTNGSDTNLCFFKLDPQKQVGLIKTMMDRFKSPQFLADLRSIAAIYEKHYAEAQKRQIKELQDEINCRAKKAQSKIDAEANRIEVLFDSIQAEEKNLVIIKEAIVFLEAELLKIQLGVCKETDYVLWQNLEEQKNIMDKLFELNNKILELEKQLCQYSLDLGMEDEMVILLKECLNSLCVQVTQLQNALLELERNAYARIDDETRGCLEQYKLILNILIMNRQSIVEKEQLIKQYRETIVRSENIIHSEKGLMSFYEEELIKETQVLKDFEEGHHDFFLTDIEKRIAEFCQIMSISAEHASSGMGFYSNISVPSVYDEEREILKTFFMRYADCVSVILPNYVAVEVDKCVLLLNSDPAQILAHLDKCLELVEKREEHMCGQHVEEIKQYLSVMKYLRLQLEEKIVARQQVSLSIPNVSESIHVVNGF